MLSSFQVSVRMKSDNKLQALKFPFKPKVTRNELRRNSVGVSHLFLLFLWFVGMYENVMLI